MNIRLLHILCLCLPIFIQAQKVIQGRVVDAKNQSIIEDVQIDVLPQKLISKTSNEGQFLFHVDSISLGLTLKFQHVNYHTKTITIDKSWIRKIYKDTLFLTVKLNASNAQLPEIAVIAERKPDTIFGSPVFSIQDYIMEDDFMILLAYTKTLRKGSTLLFTDNHQEVLDSLPLNFYAHKLFTDYSGKHFVQGDNEVYNILITDNRIHLVKRDISIYQEFTQRIIDSVHQKYYFSDYQDIYPAFSFYSMSANDSAAKTIHKVEDKFMMELYRSEYKYVQPQEKLWAARQEQKTGIDKEVWVGARYFTQSLYYKSVYAPMTVFKDTAYIFDHYSDVLYKISCYDDIKSDSVNIRYHYAIGKDKWKQPLVFDSKKHSVYALFQNTGNLYLRKVNTNNGSIESTFKLYYRYVENIKVHNGYVYYIYRPFESSQKKFIYRERIVEN
jgi:hypothetical protein